MIESWFQIPIFLKDLNSEEIHDELESAIDKVNIDSAYNIWNDTVQTSFTYSDNNRLLENCPKFQSQLYESILEYLDTFNFGHTGEVLFKDSWVNITERGQYQNFHIHAHNDISGVYYHQTTGLRDEGNIVFKSPAPNLQASKLMFFEANQVHYPPKQGRLMLFPSFLEHAVLPNMTDNKRISISFNADINGNIWPKGS